MPIASASREDNDARWIRHRKAVHGDKAHVASDEPTDPVERIVVTPANVNDGTAGCDVVILNRSLPTVRIRELAFAMRLRRREAPHGVL